MQTFVGRRARHSFTQINNAPPAKVFPLLCPVREAEWVPGWKYLMVYSESGLAEDNCVFTTPNDRGTDTVWMVTHYDPADFKISYAWVEPGMIVTQLHISLSSAGDGKTGARICYSYTGLSAAGNAVIESYTGEWFRNKMENWERAINHYLATGLMTQADAET